MEFKLGETYSGYRFLDVLKRSRNGIEYWVQNTCAQRLEVLRMLPQGAQNDREQIERFLREMRVRAQLVHPNIVTLFSAFELERQLVMTTELVEGTTLAERLTLGPLPLAEATGLIRQALELSHGNKTRAARYLGLSRPTLIYRLEKYGIELQAALPQRNR